MLYGHIGEFTVLVSVVVLLLWGPKRLPEVSASLGESVREFRKATSGAEDLRTSAPSRVPELIHAVPCSWSTLTT